MNLIELRNVQYMPKKKLGIEVHAGHGLDYKTTKILTKIDQIKEFNIGHFLLENQFLD